VTAPRQCEVEVSVKVGGRDEQLQVSVFFQLNRSIDLYAFAQRMGRAVQAAARAELAHGAGTSPLIAPLRRSGGPSIEESGK
jgi:hypothetical protein